MMFYTGVGSRQLPHEIAPTLTSLAVFLRKQGFILRSGGATGADSAFQFGAHDSPSYRIFTSQHWCHQSLQIASQFHPNWQACNPYVKKLHSRNVKQVLGDNLDDPSEFLICWTPEGKTVGGTATAINIAQYYNVPIFNLGNIKNIKSFFDFLYHNYINFK